MEKVKLSKEERLGIVTIDSPPVNALDQEVLEQLTETIDALDDELDVIIIHGAGKKAFVAGADIKDFPSLNAETGAAFSAKGQSIFQKIAELKQPVLAAIDGYALGGGLELALACDFRIASRRAQLGFPEVKLGIIPGYGGTQRLARLVGTGKAKQLIYTGEPISAEAAYRTGIVEVVTDDSALAEAKKWADKILQRGPLAVRAAKQAIDEGILLGLEEGLRLEARLFGSVCATEDKNEGAAAFLERRTPRFQRK